MRVDGERLVELAAREDLDGHVLAGGQAAFAQPLRRHLGARVEARLEI
jgi:hypothetical protein